MLRNDLIVAHGTEHRETIRKVLLEACGDRVVLGSVTNEKKTQSRFVQETRCTREMDDSVLGNQPPCKYADNVLVVKSK